MLYVIDNYDDKTADYILNRFGNLDAYYSPKLPMPI